MENNNIFFKSEEENPSLILNLKPREYQLKIFETTKDKNTLVVIPTGLGKTLIAILLSIHRLSKYPASKIIFLAPTRPLVEQHYQTYKKQLPELFADIQIFTGSVNAEKRKNLFNKADIIFSTPQCISNDLKNSLYTLEEVSLLIIDEAHRCLKNYDYTKVVCYFKEQSRNQRILGLTASPGHEISKIREICNHLDLDEIEVRSRDSPDVRPYLQHREFNKIEVSFPEEFSKIRSILKKIYEANVNELKSRDFLTVPDNKITLLKLQSSLAERATRGDFSAMHAMSYTAKAIKISYAIELLETQTISGLYEYLKSLQKQASENKSRAVRSLVKDKDFNEALLLINELLIRKIEHPKIQETASIVEKEIKENASAKLMIFTQFRETASSLFNKLSQINGINPSVFIGQAKKSNSKGISSGLNQKEQKEIIEKFRAGEINVLICTAIGEEGLDIPEVSSVIFYEPIPSAIRKIQRAGRTARLAPGKLIILITKDTRDEIHHYASSARERKMYKVINIVKEELKKLRESKNLDFNKDNAFNLTQK